MSPRPFASGLRSSRGISTLSTWTTNSGPGGSVRVRFWGTRGSIATPGPGTVRFGGNTSCVEVTTSGGACFIFDCGTGARPLGAELMAHAPKPISAVILLSHTHWDHIQGFPFFAPLFVRGNQITVCGPEGSGHSLAEVLAGQMEFTYFPVDLSQLPATITFRELGEGTHDIDGARIVAQYLHHPAMTLGYRVEADGAAVVYACDHEPFSEMLWHENPALSHAESIVHEGDRRHARFMAGADMVIHDAQYTPEESPSKKNW
ncbi:MAG TPA: MBL fold metallo-hydrolase, partial [Candidatus Eisenbacteria bacterium]|nr:MBL fold metallo-hydrolase [Candidatus Eisenbacteria bacterium]